MFPERSHFEMYVWTALKVMQCAVVHSLSTSLTVSCLFLCHACVPTDTNNLDQSIFSVFITLGLNNTDTHKDFVFKI